MVFIATVLTGIVAAAAFAVLGAALRRAWPLIARLRRDLHATPATVSVRYAIRGYGPATTRPDPRTAQRRTASLGRRTRRLALKRAGRPVRPAANAA